MNREEELKLAKEAILMTEDDFVYVYRPILNHLDLAAGFDWGEGRGTLF